MHVLFEQAEHEVVVGGTIPPLLPNQTMKLQQHVPGDKIEKDSGIVIVLYIGVHVLICKLAVIGSLGLVGD